MVSATTTPIGRRVANGPLQQGGAGRGVNVGDAERLLSLAGGGLLALYGLSRGNLPGLGLAAVGGALVYRGLSGHRDLYQALGVNTGEAHGPAASVAAGKGFKVVCSMTIQQPAGELYQAWRDFERLPGFMSHLEC